MSGSGWEVLPQFWEWLGVPLVVQELSGGPSTLPGVVGRPSRRNEIGQEALPEVWEWSRGPSTVLGVVGRPS